MQILPFAACQASNCECLTAYSHGIIVDKLITGDKYATKCCILELESILLQKNY